MNTNTTNLNERLATKRSIVQVPAEVIEDLFKQKNIELVTKVFNGNTKTSGELRFYDVDGDLAVLTLDEIGTAHYTRTSTRDDDDGKSDGVLIMKLTANKELTIK